MIPTSIDGTDITGATIDGQDVQEITVDGDTVFTAGPPPGNFQFDAQDLSLANGDPVTSWPDTLGRDTLTGGTSLEYDTTTMNDAAVTTNSTSANLQSSNTSLIDLCKAQDLSLTFTFALPTSIPNNAAYFTFDTGGNERLQIQDGNKNQATGAIKYRERNASSGAEHNTAAGFNDGQPHICVITNSGGGVTATDFYVDDMANTASKVAVTGDRGVNRTTFSGTNLFALFEGNTGVGITIAFLRIDDKILTQAERQAIKDSRPEL